MSHEPTTSDPMRAFTGEKFVGSDDELFSLSELRAVSEPVECICGVYILFDGDEPVYVGQSVNVSGRVGIHVSERTKVFDRVAIVEADPEYLDYIESRYILELKPRYNGSVLPLSRMAIKCGYRRRCDFEAPIPMEKLQEAMNRAFADFPSETQG